MIFAIFVLLLSFLLQFYDFCYNFIIDQQHFHQTLASQAMLELSQIFCYLLDVVFGDENDPRLLAMYSPLIQNLVPILRDRLNLGNKKSMELALKLLVSGNSYNFPIKAWKASLLEVFNDNDVSVKPVTLL